MNGYIKLLIIMLLTSVYFQFKEMYRSKRKPTFTDWTVVAIQLTMTSLAVVGGIIK